MPPGSARSAAASSGPAAFIAPVPSTTTTSRDGACGVAAGSVWRMIASLEATSAAERSGVHAVVTAAGRSTVTAANGVGLGGSASLPRTSSPPATRSRTSGGAGAANASLLAIQTAWVTPAGTSKLRCVK